MKLVASVEMLPAISIACNSMMVFTPLVNGTSKAWNRLVVNSQELVRWDRSVTNAC